MGLTNQFFDGGDYEQPIKTSFQNEFSYHFISGYIVEKHLKVRLNKVIDYNNRWYEFSPKEYTFFSVESVHDAFQMDDGSGDLMRLRVILDPRYQMIERRVYTIYDMLGQVGGFFGIILTAGKI